MGQPASSADTADRAAAGGAAHQPAGSGDGFDRLVQLVYKGPLEAKPWSSLLDALVRELGCSNAAMTLRIGRKGVPPLVVWARPLPVKGEAAKAIRRRHAQLGDLDILSDSLSPECPIASLDEIMDPARIEAHPFYCDVLKPYGFRRLLGMHLAEPWGWTGRIGLVGSMADRDFGDRERALLLRLRPHIEQSLQIFARLSREETEVDALIATLDRLTIATFILAESGSLLRVNRAGRRMLEAQRFITEHDGRIVLHDRASNIELQDVITRCREMRRSYDETPVVAAFRIDRGDGAHCGMLVRSIERSSELSGFNAPMLILHISESRPVRPLEGLVAQLFDLTPSEAQLATLLASGHSLIEAARIQGLTESTVRTYCKTLLSKTGVGRQSDLVSLIMRSVAVLG